MRCQLALFSAVCLLRASCFGFVTRGASVRAPMTLFAKKKSGQKQADLMKQLEAAKRQKAQEEASSAAAPEALSSAPRELPTPNKDWRQGGAPESASASSDDYDEMEALLGSVDSAFDVDTRDAAQELSGEVEPRDSWSYLLEPSGAPVSWMDAVVRGGPLYVVADPRGGSQFGQVLRDLNAKVSANTPGSVVVVSADEANDLRKLAKKSSIDLSKIQLLSDHSKKWLLAHKCVGPEVHRLSMKLFVIDLKAGGGVVRDVVELDDLLSVADIVVRKMSE